MQCRYTAVQIRYMCLPVLSFAGGECKEVVCAVALYSRLKPAPLRSLHLGDQHITTPFASKRSHPPQTAAAAAPWQPHSVTAASLCWACQDCQSVTRWSSSKLVSELVSTSISGFEAGYICGGLLAQLPPGPFGSSGFRCTSMSPAQSRL